MGCINKDKILTIAAWSHDWNKFRGCSVKGVVINFPIPENKILEMQEAVRTILLPIVYYHRGFIKYCPNKLIVTGVTAITSQWDNLSLNIGVK